MAISFSTLRANIYTTLYNHLHTGTYKITSYDNIHPSYNRLQRIQQGYPQIIINEPIVSINKITMGATGSVYECNVTINIDIYEDSSADVKSVADEVTNKIISGRSVLSAAGLKRVNFEPDSVDVEPYSQVKTLHTYTITVTGMYYATS